MGDSAFHFLFALPKPLIFFFKVTHVGNYTHANLMLVKTSSISGKRDNQSSVEYRIEGNFRMVQFRIFRMLAGHTKLKATKI